MTRNEYNGWTNYETWAVALWMDNEQGTQEHFHAQAKEYIERHDDPAMRVILFAEAIEEQHKEQLPELQGFAADLLNAAMSEVNWREIAAHTIDSAQQ